MIRHGMTVLLMKGDAVGMMKGARVAEVMMRSMRFEIEG